jgi:PhnB protein
MQTLLNPYLSFQDNTRRAMEFYQTVFGGNLVMRTFKDYNASQDPGDDHKIMHAILQADNGITFMAADTPKGMEHGKGTNISMTLSGDNMAELRGYFEGLSAGGMVEQPLTQSPWGDTFGMLTDRFGTHWMVNITTPKA